MPAQQGVGASSPAEEDVLHRELRLLRHLHHEHLVRVHGILETDQGPALLMDLAVGGSLLDLVRSRGPLPMAEVVTTLVPVAQSLGHLHQAGALHGDITPGNILFTHEGKPLLSDFGTGRLLGAEQLDMSGTPGFVDPASTTAYDAGIDVFALSAVAWFALTGRVPGPSEQRPPLALIVPEVPDALMHLIEDGLSSDRERRPSAASFARTLLAASTPGAVNLVPAVHASVLPELLTRRSGNRPAEPTSRWGRLAARRAERRRARRTPRGDAITIRRSGSQRRPRRSHVEYSRPADGRQPSPSRGAPVGSGPDRGFGPGGRLERPGRATPRASDRRSTVDRRTTREDSPGQSRVRRLLAVALGCTAVVLLVVGIALTIRGLPGSDQVLTEPAMQGGEPPAIEPSGYSGEPPTEVPTAPDKSSIDAPAQEHSPPAAAAEVTVGGSGADGVVTGEDPVAALQALVDRRVSAFTNVDPAILREVDVEGSPAMTADQRALDAHERSGTRLRDLSIAVREAIILTGSEPAEGQVSAPLPGIAEHPDDVEAVAVRATMQLSSYTTENLAGADAAGSDRRQDASGDPASAPSPLMAAGQQELVFVLWDTAEGWRIHSVVEP